MKLKSQLKIFLIIIGIAVISSSQVYAQSIRSLVNEGVEKYKKDKYADAEVDFKKGTEKAPESFQAKFNLGDALYKQKRYDESIKTYKSALELAKTKNEKAKVYYNIGNSLLKAKKIKESIGAYKESLKLNPNDQEAKYNLSYALSQLKNQKKNNKSKNNKNDKNKNNKKNKDKQKQNKNDKNKNQKKNQDQQKQKNQESKQDKTKQQQQQPQKISKEQAKRILDALKDNEKELQKKLRKIKGKRIKTDKDW